MKFSHNWLQTYFNEPLPEPQKLAERLTFHSFEVESLSQEGDDWIFEIAILPNRRHDCLSHRGIAREISVVTGIPLARDPFLEKVPAWNIPKGLSAKIEDASGAPRYMVALLHGVLVKESPEWLQERLRAIGQKPINNIVDAANFVMFELGQPFHAFDADRFAKDGDAFKIGVRNAKKGEAITILGGEERTLESDDLVIVDGVNDALLGIAGVKGGVAAEITEHTKNIIIESANWNPARVRATATRLGLRTDASLRFESGLAPEQAEYAMKEAIMLVEKLTGAELLGVCDVGKWQKKGTATPLSVEEINKLLGTSMDEGDFKSALVALQFEHRKEGEEFLVTPPFERLDVKTKEDLIEEAGRVYGYEKIRALPLQKADKSPAVNKIFYYTEKIRDILVRLGYSEVYTHAIGTEGEVELENPLAEDKRFLRDSIAGTHQFKHGFLFNDILLQNNKNKELLGIETIKIFEIGKIFTQSGEQWELALGASKERDVEEAKSALMNGLMVPEETFHVKGQSLLVSGSAFPIRLYLSLAPLIETLIPPKEYTSYQKPETEPRYRRISLYPFVLRDIAVFVPEGTEHNAVCDMIKEEAGSLLVGIRLFDEFRKGDKISYALRLVFQSHEKTLSDGEVNEIMAKVTHTLNSQEGFMVR